LPPYLQKRINPTAAAVFVLAATARVRGSM
jgi:hypothetical protein